MATKKELTAQLNALKKRQLTTQLNALNQRTAGYQPTIKSNISAMTAAKIDAEQPYVEELPAEFEASIPELMKSIPINVTKQTTNQTQTGKTVVSTYTDPNTGDIYLVWSDGSKTLSAKGGNQQRSQSAFELFRGFLNQYGLGALAADVEKYKLDGLSNEELLLRLRTESKAYKQRFAANEARIAKGLRALSEAEYIGLEDKYQDIMRRYGLPETYYTRGEMGRQEGFEKFIGLDVSPVELEDRIATAQQRVINADVNVSNALKQFYPDITNGDILAYTLDPKNALENIKRKVTAAEIGGAAMAQGLNRGTTPEEIAAYAARANELAGYGVTRAQAQQGYGAIAEFLPTAEKLGDIYAKQGMGPYDQLTAEQEVFGTAGAAGAATKRKKLSELEKAAFGAQSGLAQGALARDRAGAY